MPGLRIHVVINHGFIKSVDCFGSVVERGKQVCSDILDFACVLIQCVQDIFDVHCVEAQQPLSDPLGRDLRPVDAEDS